MAAELRVLDTKAKAKAEVVQEAERVLELAKSGEIVDLCWVAANPDGSTQNHWTATEDQQRRLAAVSRLLHRLHRSADDD